MAGDFLVRVTPDGYEVSCQGIEVVGHGPTETAAWNDFWSALHTGWKPTDAPPSVGRSSLLNRLVRRFGIHNP